MQLTHFDDIQTRHRHIFLSPHFDDAVFSCGGTIGVQVSCGLRPLVITIFGGAPPAGQELSSYAGQVQRGMGFRQDADAAVAARRQEDAKALDYLGADYLWLDYPDAIYRGTPAYYTQESQLIGGDVHAGDLGVDKQLAQDLLALHERLPDTVWYAPLGIGRHVDHQIVCSAADRLIQRGVNVKLYEDFPYVLNADALEARLAEFGSRLEPALVEVSEMLPQRQEAAAMYTSQVPVLFGETTTMHKLMDDYAYNIRPVATVRLERYWTAR
ncbi:MAG: PIG-L family deacetylase [Ktedonobacteraceae bacterium]|nr:PIG-L family deacetylase [Ktedonobacteraceae bacterium]